MIKAVGSFAGLLDLMVEGVRNASSVEASNLGRLADFMKYCKACGLKDFEPRFRQNQDDDSLALLEDSALANAVKAFIEEHGQPWEGNMTALEKALRDFGYQAAKGLRSLSVELRHLAPALRKGFGIEVVFPTRRLTWISKL